MPGTVLLSEWTAANKTDAVLTFNGAHDPRQQGRKSAKAAG